MCGIDKIKIIFFSFTFFNIRIESIETKYRLEPSEVNTFHNCRLNYEIHYKQLYYKLKRDWISS